MSWPADPFVYDWKPHPHFVHEAPAQSISTWAATAADARATLFLLVGLAIRRAV
jgi:hypothetical protein